MESIIGAPRRISLARHSSIAQVIISPDKWIFLFLLSVEIFETKPSQTGRLVGEIVARTTAFNAQTAAPGRWTRFAGAARSAPSRLSIMTSYSVSTSSSSSKSKSSRVIADPRKSVSARPLNQIDCTSVGNSRRACAAAEIIITSPHAHAVHRVSRGINTRFGRITGGQRNGFRVFPRVQFKAHVHVSL